MEVENEKFDSIITKIEKERCCGALELRELCSIGIPAVLIKKESESIDDFIKNLKGFVYRSNHIRGTNFGSMIYMADRNEIDSILNLQIDVKELRVDDYVLFKSEICRINMINRGDVIEVSTIDSDSTKEHFVEETLPDRIHPIPLTENLLTKCGFKECDDCEPIIKYSYRNEDFKVCIFIYELNSFVLRIFNIKSGEQICGMNISFIHQLQNIYFDLTGKELDIKL